MKTFDLTQTEPEEVVSYLIQQARINMTVQSIEKQCIRAAETGIVWLDEEAIDEIKLSQPNIYRSI